MDIYMKRVALTPNRHKSSYPKSPLWRHARFLHSENISIAESREQLAPKPAQWIPAGAVHSAWDSILRSCLTQKPLLVIGAVRSGGQTWTMGVSGSYEQNEPEGFAQLIFECHPVCWSMVDLEEPLGPVLWKKLSSSPCISRCWGTIELLKSQYYFKCLWVSLGCPSSSPGGWRILTRIRWLWSASNDTRCFTANCWEESSIQRRKSCVWESGWAGDLLLS